MMTDFYALPPEAQGERLAALAHSALSHWGLEGAHLEVIKMRENAVFRTTSPDGTRHALRIHRHNYHSDAALHSELSWIRALESAGIAVPELVPARTGELFVRVRHPQVPEPRQVDLFAWVDGRQLGSSESGAEGSAGDVAMMFRTIGTLTARMHDQASAWDLPAGFTRHAWDTEGLVGEQPFWGRFWELAALTDEQRDLLGRARERVRVDLDTFGRTTSNYSLIHADFTPENLLVDGDTIRPIDFDDAGFGWHLFDLATTLYFHQDADYFQAARAALIEGYRRERELSDRDLAHLPLFLLARGFTYLGWVHTRHETQTARELTPVLVDMACRLATDYLKR